MTAFKTGIYKTIFQNMLARPYNQIYDKVIFNGINFVPNLIFIKSFETKRQLLKELKEYTKSVLDCFEAKQKECEKNKKVVFINHQAFNYSKNTTEIIHQLTNGRNQYSLINQSDGVLDNTLPGLRKDILEGVSFYSTQSISKEWDTLRNTWYQNNTQFKPKFRKNSIIVFYYLDKLTPGTSAGIPTNNLSFQNTVNQVNTSLFKNINDNRN